MILSYNSDYLMEKCHTWSISYIYQMIGLKIYLGQCDLRIFHGSVIMPYILNTF